MGKPKKLDYVDVVYNETDRPLTDYPSKLTRYLFDRYRIEKESKLLDIGCGRGEFLKGFMNCGVEGYGVDQSDSSKQLVYPYEIIAYYGIALKKKILTMIMFNIVCT